MLMTDHPGWLITEDGDHHRAVTHGETTTLVTYRCATGEAVTDTGGVSVRFDAFDPAVLAGPDDLVAPLKSAGVVERMANPSLWDAIATAIMRQVIKAGHARARYVRFCEAFGEPATSSDATAWLFPAPQQILTLSDDDFRQLGAAFPMPVLRAAAHAYLDKSACWHDAAPADLVDLLQQVPRIGPWTAEAAVADYTNDFAFYPYTDIAVQAWAKRLNPDREWPTGAAAFGAAWEQVAGEQLSTWTILTLAWGINHGNLARSAP